MTEGDDDHSFLTSWTPDSRTVLIARDRGGDERARLYRVGLDTPGELTLLTDDDPEYFLRGGELPPNGRWLVYGANADLAAGREIEQIWVYRHDLVTDERRVLARPAKAGGGYPLLNATGDLVLYTRKDRHRAGQQLWLVDVEGGVFSSPPTRRRTHASASGSWMVTAQCAGWSMSRRVISSAFVPPGSLTAPVQLYRERYGRSPAIAGLR